MIVKEENKARFTHLRDFLYYNNKYFVFQQERQYKQISSVDQLAIHFALDGNMLHKESDEAKRQRARLGLPEGMMPVFYGKIMPFGC